MLSAPLLQLVVRMGRDVSTFQLGLARLPYDSFLYPRVDMSLTGHEQSQRMVDCVVWRSDRQEAKWTTRR